MAPWRLWNLKDLENSNASKQMVGLCFECPLDDPGYLQSKVDLQGLIPRFPWGSCQHLEPVTELGVLVSALQASTPLWWGDKETDFCHMLTQWHLHISGLVAFLHLVHKRPPGSSWKACHSLEGCMVIFVISTQEHCILTSSQIWFWIEVTFFYFWWTIIPAHLKVQDKMQHLT